MLQFENVSFRYAEDDFDMMRNLNFQVEDREFVSIIGASGCGKSTIFRLINGLEKLQQGRILVDGRPVQELKNYSAFMPQKDLLFPWRTIEKNICLPMELAKVPKAEQEKRCKEVLEQVGLSEYAKKYPKDLSGGMKQRVAFARTLLSGADLLLFVGDAVNDRVIHADARRGREAVQVQEIGSCTVAHDKVIDDFVDLCGSDTGFNRFAASLQGSSADRACLAHFLQLGSVFDLDHG